MFLTRINLEEINLYNDKTTVLPPVFFKSRILYIDFTHLKSLVLGNKTYD